MRDRRRRPPPAALEGAVRGAAARWPHLDEQQVERLHEVAASLLRRLRWSATADFAVDDGMRVHVATRAAVLVVALPGRPYPDVREVVLAPTTQVLRGPRRTPVPHVVEEGVRVLGHTATRGPVFLSWDAVRRDASHPERGRDVVLHEFAHRLDVADGWFDGMPPLRDPALRERWIEVCTAEMAAVRERPYVGVLRGYAGTNPAEFFAVATEVLFTRPDDLAAVSPELFEVLTAFYGQDPRGSAGAPSAT